MGSKVADVGFLGKVYRDAIVGLKATRQGVATAGAKAIFAKIEAVTDLDIGRTPGFGRLGQATSVVIDLCFDSINVRRGLPPGFGVTKIAGAGAQGED